MEYYNIDRNLVTVSNSILKHFNCPRFHRTCKELDEILEKTNKKICMILLDGFGSLVQENHKEYCPYILNHKRFTITSVFPPTTAAATTSLLTGKYPVETGWLGWNQKFKMWPHLVTMFRSVYAIDRETPTPETIDKVINLTYIDEIIKTINKDKKIKTLKSLDLKDREIKTFFDKTNEECKDADFLYAYLTDPDHTLHIYGANSKEVNEVMKKIDVELEKLVTENPDVLFITLADHGHIDCVEMDINDHPDLCKLLDYKYFTLEQRAAIFYVKEKHKDEFYKLAKKYYGEYFDIYSKDEIRREHIFGWGIENKYFDECIGDFLLIANSNRCLYQDCSPHLISQHAGGTDLEKYINIGIYND